MSELLKYYWVSYKHDSYDKQLCTDIHPFQFIDSLQRLKPIHYGSVTSYRLVDWKLIDVEEYILWEKLNNEKD